MSFLNIYYRVKRPAPFIPYIEYIIFYSEFRTAMKHFKWPLFIAGLLVTIIVTPLIVTLLLKGFLCWKEPIAGPVTAITLVFYSYFLAPGYKDIVAVSSFFIGAVFAYATPDIHWYPECHELAYQSTYIPLAITYVAGLIALAYCLYLSKIKLNN